MNVGEKIRGDGWRGGGNLINFEREKEEEEK